jgi:hypothetical protein
MKFELTTLEAINLNQAIMAAQERVKGAKLGLGMRLAYNAKKLKPIAETFEENRTKLLGECAERDANDDLVLVENGNIKLADLDRFNNGVKDMLSESFDVDLKPLDENLFPETVDADIVAGLFAIIVEDAA